MTDKLPAGNTGRHEDSILWDRLRADLANLGAAYGELPTLSDLSKDRCVDFHGQSVRLSGDPAEVQGFRIDEHGWTERLFGDGCTQYSPPAEPDLNLYYDGIILAARKKREARTMETHTCRHCGSVSDNIKRNAKCVVRCCENHMQGRQISQALSVPLSFPKRIGWKPGDCE